MLCRPNLFSYRRLVFVVSVLLYVAPSDRVASSPLASIDFLYVIVPDGLEGRVAIIVSKGVENCLE